MLDCREEYNLCHQKLHFENEKGSFCKERDQENRGLFKRKCWTL